ncbi:hypothetical protein PEC301645_35590 [Pectobacterium carotovorum subsp. carotovorum]|nr:hypothetical protein PEC301645_35590 [Pectobacterium carotovorum subsp. carotovorum]
MCRIYCAAHQISVRTIYTPLAQSVTQKLLTSAGSWSPINVATQTGNGKVRVAVTRDRVNWHVLRNGARVDVGTLSANTAGAEALIADSVTFRTVTAGNYKLAYQVP